MYILIKECSISKNIKIPIFKSKKLSKSVKSQALNNFVVIKSAKGGRVLNMDQSTDDYICIRKYNRKMFNELCRDVSCKTCRPVESTLDYSILDYYFFKWCKH